MPAAVRSLTLTLTSADQRLVSVEDFGLRAVERKMRSLARADTVVAPVRLAVQHHLESASSRQRARWVLAAAHAVGVNLADAVALAACAEMLHSATLLRDDTQNRVTARGSRPAVWVEYGDDIATCAADLLVSAAYAAVAAVSGRTCVAALVQIIHAAIATSIDGRAKIVALDKAFVSDYAVYERVAAEASPFSFSLPLELVLAFAGCEDAVAAARRLAEHLSVALQIADDLEVVGSNDIVRGNSEWLNVVTVLRNMGSKKPFEVASANAYAALRESIRNADQLPCGIGERLTPEFEGVFEKIQAATRRRAPAHHSDAC